MALLASDVYAMSQSRKNEGPDRCHWCGAATTKRVPHGVPAPAPFTKKQTTARFPGNQYICIGCQLWRRERITVMYLEGGLKDGQCPGKWSWIVTPTAALSPTKNKTDIYRVLLKPPPIFFMSIHDGSTGLSNLLHLAEVNDSMGKAWTNDAIFKFNVNNSVMEYTIYELEHALKSGPEGRLPGVQWLLSWFGRPQIEDQPTKARGPGRPPTKEESRPGDKV